MARWPLLETLIVPAHLACQQPFSYRTDAQLRHSAQKAKGLLARCLAACSSWAPHQHLQHEAVSKTILWPGLMTADGLTASANGNAQDDKGQQDAQQADECQWVLQRRSRLAGNARCQAPRADLPRQLEVLTLAGDRPPLASAFVCQNLKQRSIALAEVASLEESACWLYTLIRLLLSSQKFLVFLGRAAAT